MTDNTPTLNVLDLYRKAGALHEGHFLLASGRHSPYFLQTTTLLQYPQYTAQLGQALADKLRLLNINPDFVIGPAMGGVVLAYEVARNLPEGTRALFAEKDGQGGMQIRSAFTVKKGQTFVAVEDVLTTGGSVLKAVQAAEYYGATCLAIACIIDRRLKTEALAGYTLVSLEEIYFETYEHEEVPDWLSERPLQEI